MDDTILVFTGRSIEQMIKEGGSQAWALHATRARRSRYLVCTQNRHNELHRTGKAPHGTAFMVGKIGDVIDSTEEAGRYTIVFTEFARVDIPNVWGGWRNPVKYTSLEELGIDPASLTFEPVPDGASDSTSAPDRPASPAFGSGALSPEAAKRGVAAYFGVPVEAVQITIRT